MEKACVKMTKFIILLSLCALGYAKSIAPYSASNQAVDIINRYGYPVETREVTTQDGYILDVFRIPHGRNQDMKKFDDKPVVLLMHGFMSSSEDFLMGGPEQGLAFQLADRGYDVFLGNARGSAYGQRHTTLNPHKDSAFWRYCWHEIGTRDLPAIIDEILAMTNKEKISYIGHMEGTTSFLALNADRPELSSKINRSILLGPIGYVKNSHNLILKKIAEHSNTKAWMLKNLGMNVFRPGQELLDEVKVHCKNYNENKNDMCDNVYFLFNGYESSNYNQSVIQQVQRREPHGGAVREVLAYVQNMESGRFQKYSENFQDNEPMEYDLSQVNVPVALFYTPNDRLSNPQDVQMLAQKLPQVYYLRNDDQLDNNLDYVYGNYIGDKLFPKIYEALEMKLGQSQALKQKDNYKKNQQY